MFFSDKFIKAQDDYCDFGHHVPAPYFRKTFELAFVPDQAEITICGLGFYELWINGKRLTKGALAPYISNLNDIRYYDNYDITNVLHYGKNVVTVLLGNGFRNSFGGFIWDFEKASFRGAPALALSLDASAGFVDVKPFHMEADESFKTAPSPITFDEERMGCRYDARLEIPGVHEVDFDDSSWAFAKKEKTPAGYPKLCEAEPIVETMRIKPVSVTHFDSLPYAYQTTSHKSLPYPQTVRNDVYVYDFGVNSAGVTELRLKNTRPGQKITIRHGEALQNGLFSINTIIFNRPESIDAYLEYASTDVYTCKGGDEEVFLPIFKYDGFQYAYVEGLTPEQATKDALTFVVMNSDLKERAAFRCSSDTLNTLFTLTRRSDLANFYYFPTDCPHREKNGWTGDASMSAEQMLLNLTSENSYREWLHNIRAEQAENGAIPGIVPTGGWGYAWGNGPTWDSICVNPIYYIYKFTGNTAVIEENVSMIMRYLTYVMTRRNEKGLVSFGLGDWCDPFQAQNGKISAPLAFTDSAMVFDIANKAAFLFRAVNRSLEADYAASVAHAMREAIRRELMEFPSMRVAGNCETTIAVAIEMGLFDPDEIPAARQRLIQTVHEAGDVNTCGMIGLRYIFRALTRAGAYDLAYKLITDTGRSGYGYWIEHGATSLWEAFFDFEDNVGGSHNHHFFGDISSVFVQEFAGIAPNPYMNDPLYFRIQPYFVSALTHAEASYISEKGKITVAWKRDKDTVSLTVTAPEGTRGEIMACPGYTVCGNPVYRPGDTATYTFRKI